MAARTIATEHLHHLLMTAGQTQATHHALKAELRAVLHVDGGSGGPPIAIGAGASQGLVVRPRPVNTLTLVEEPWYAVGLALIRSGALLWKTARNRWGLVMILIGVRDFLDEFAEEGRRRAAAVATAGAAAGAASARVRARSSLMIRPRLVTTLTLVEKPWYAVGLALIRSGALLWKTARNRWGLVMILIGVRDFLDEFAEEGRRRAAAVATAGAAAGAASARVERPSLLMEPPRASPPRSPSSARTAPAQQTMGALGGAGGRAAGGLASTPNDALNPVTGGGKTGERTIEVRGRDVVSSAPVDRVRDMTTILHPSQVRAAQIQTLQAEILERQAKLLELLGEEELDAIAPAGGERKDSPPARSRRPGRAEASAAATPAPDAGAAAPTPEASEPSPGKALMVAGVVVGVLAGGGGRAASAAPCSAGKGRGDDGRMRSGLPDRVPIAVRAPAQPSPEAAAMGASEASRLRRGRPARSGVHLHAEGTAAGDDGPGLPAPASRGSRADARQHRLLPAAPRAMPERSSSPTCAEPEHLRLMVAPGARCRSWPSRPYLLVAEAELGAVDVDTVRKQGEERLGEHVSAVGLCVELPFLASDHLRWRRETRLERTIVRADCGRPRAGTRRRRGRPTAVGRPAVGHLHGGRSSSPIIRAMEQVLTTGPSLPRRDSSAVVGVTDDRALQVGAP